MQLGAACSLVLVSGITHLVAGGAHTEKVTQARKKGIPVVSIDWLYAAGALCIDCFLSLIQQMKWSWSCQCELSFIAPGRPSGCTDKAVIVESMWKLCFIVFAVSYFLSRKWRWDDASKCCKDSLCLSMQPFFGREWMKQTFLSPLRLEHQGMSLKMWELRWKQQEEVGVRRVYRTWATLMHAANDCRRACP